MKGLFLLLFTLSMTLFSAKSTAAPERSFYSTFSYSWGGVLSDSEFYKGASDWGPGLDIGFKFHSFSLEFIYKKYSLENEHASSGSEFLITLSDHVVAFGARFEYLPGLDLKLGWASHNLSTTFETTQGRSTLGNLIVGSFTGFYTGVGLRGLFFRDDLEWLTELTYYHGSERIAVLAVEFGIRYHFASY